MSDEIEKVAIIGMSGAFPGAKNIGELWKLLCEGRDGISTLSREELLRAGESPENADNPDYVPRGGFLDEAEYFDNSFFGVSPADALAMDPQQRLFLQHSWLALEDAGCDPAALNDPVGVFAGEGATQYWFLLKNGPFTRSLEDFRLMLGNEKDFVATRTSYKLNLKGPSVDIQSACSTSMAAVAFACQSLLTWGCDLALAGGVTVTAPRKLGYHAYEGMISSPTGTCRPFDAKADGTLFGEGVGVVCLKRLSEAVAAGDCIYAVIGSVAMNNDGSDKVGFTAPSVNGQTDVIQMAQALADVSGDDVEYVETHGTGTPLGDPIEIQALTNAFRKTSGRTNYCYLGSIKSSIGHLDVAAGIASLIKTSLILNTGIIPPLVNFESANPHLGIENSPFRINTAVVDWQKKNGRRVAGVSSFGIGGTNVHAILESPPEVQVRAGRAGGQILFGARSPDSLRDYLTRSADFLESNPSVSGETLASKINRTRHDFPLRRGIVFRNREELLEELKKPLGNISEAVPGKTMFVFPGQGSQFPAMARAYYGSLSVFTEWVDKGLALAESARSQKLRAFLLEEGFDDETARTENTQPLLYIIEYALAKQLSAEGIVPSALAGHSIGEFAAAAFGGAMSFEDGFRLVCARGRLMQSAPPGAMLAVMLTATEAAAYVGGGISVSVQNTDSQVVLSGTLNDIDALEASLKERAVKYVRLKTSHAFHSPLMEAILPEFASEVRKIVFSPLSIPILSNLDGAWLSGTVDWNAYWVSQLRQPVRFDLCVREIGKTGNLHVIEAGPGRALTGFLKASFPDRADFFPTLANAKSDARFFGKSLVQFWERGVEVAWKSDPFLPSNPVLFAGYPFARNRFWPKAGESRFSAPKLMPDTQDSLSEDKPGVTNDVRDSIRNIWRAILGNDSFDDETNFFLCGGDSFAGIQLLEKLKSALGISILMKDFIQLPTITGIVAMDLEPPAQNATGKYIFPIQTKGDRPALFMVAGAHDNRYFDSDTMKNSYEEDFYRYFSILIPALGYNQPLYGFRPKGLAMNEPQHSSVPVMARAFIQAMKEVQPKGPYYIGGECVGGVVAMEMASLLEEEGECVGCLFLMDTPRPGLWVAFREFFNDGKDALREMIKRQLHTAKSNGILSCAASLRSVLPLILINLFPISYKTRMQRRALNGSLNYLWTLLKHRPRSFNGNVTYIVNHFWNKQRFLMGWGRELGSKLHVYEVPGYHWTRLVVSGKLIGEIIKDRMGRNN